LIRLDLVRFAALGGRGSAVAVVITRTELDAAGLREAATRCKDAAASRRMLALALVLEGSNRTQAARATGMDRQTLRDWVHRYNAEGIAGLNDAPRSGRPPVLSEGQITELKELVLAGPELERDGVVRWRCVDLQTVIAERYKVSVHERTVGKLLRRMGMTRLQPRPSHPKQDAAAQTAFKKTSLTV
jgi:transposase